MNSEIGPLRHCSGVCLLALGFLAAARAAESRVAANHFPPNDRLKKGTVPGKTKPTPTKRGNAAGGKSPF